jgi:hypothetical protein
MRRKEVSQPDEQVIQPAQQDPDGQRNQTNHNTVVEMHEEPE